MLHAKKKIMPDKRVIVTLVLLVLLVVNLSSQQNKASIHFEESQHNLGPIKEEDGPVKHDFLFTNKGEDPLVVTNVRTSGGISVVQWTRNPVVPGAAGSVTVEFNPQNMHGKFNRVVTVNSTGSPPTTVLRLLGEVIPRERTPEELFPREIGQLRLRSNHISLGTVHPGHTKADSVEMINLSEETLELSLTLAPSHLTAKITPQKLQPGEKGYITASFDAGVLDDWGVVTSNVRIRVNDATPPGNVLYISANIQEDFSVMTEDEKKNAPSIEFSERVFDFGSLKHGESVEHDFTFTNTGGSELIIRKVRSGCGCTAIEPQKTLLTAGESSSVKAVFNSRGFRGKQNKGITVISNDPEKPSILLRITGEVIE